MRLAAVEQRVEGGVGVGTRGDGDRRSRSVSWASIQYGERLRGRLMLALYRVRRPGPTRSRPIASSSGCCATSSKPPGAERACVGRAGAERSSATTRRCPRRWPLNGARNAVEPAARAAALPAGTVTFLFTDIEGSTRLLGELEAERYLAGAGAALGGASLTVAAHGGRVFGTKREYVLRRVRACIRRARCRGARCRPR